MHRREILKGVALGIAVAIAFMLVIGAVLYCSYKSNDKFSKVCADKYGEFNYTFMSTDYGAVCIPMFCKVHGQDYDCRNFECYEDGKRVLCLPDEIRHYGVRER